MTRMVWWSGVRCDQFPTNPPRKGSWQYFWRGFWHGFRWHDGHWTSCRTCAYYEGRD